MNILILLSVFFPIVSGVGLLLLPKKWLLPVKEGEKQKRGRLISYTGAVLGVETVLVLYTLWKGMGTKVVLLYLLDSSLEILFSVDRLGQLFVAMAAVVWLLAGIFSFEYMKHSHHEKRYFGFYLITYGVLVALGMSGNLVTMYLFFEMMTLVSMPLVLHDGTKEAMMAGLKYLFYSFGGAYMALFGLFFLYRNCETLSFLPGGSLSEALLQETGQGGVVLLAAFLTIIGYGVKAGMFPLHAWLPTAHPVAPAPASAVLSGVIVKGGVFAMIRVIYYCIGTEFIRGTWVQYTWLVLAMITVLMGSMLAWREQVLKKRLAYSTVSQLSYILLGLAVLNPVAMEGALLHMIFHSVMKALLFLGAGAIIFRTGRQRVEELKGIGRELPVTLWCFTIASLGLIGIPPFCGFVSKWYLGTGALAAGTEEGLGVFAYMIPVVLLISALLTAAYLLPIGMQGFLPGKDFVSVRKVQEENKECSPVMLLPMIVLAALVLLLGLFPNPLRGVIGEITKGLF